MNARICFIILFLILFTPILTSAMPPLDGKWEPDYPPGVNSPDRGIATRDGADYEGQWRCLILLIDFEDYTWDKQDDENFPNEDRIYTQDHYASMLFSEDEYQHPGAENEYTGSMRDYYREISNGMFETIGTVSLWYRAPEPLTYYCNNDGEDGTPDDYGFGAYPNNVRKLVEDVLELADDDVNFSEFDNDENGVIDGLFIVHAGPGAETTGRNANYIWSHKWQIEEQERDNVFISTYSMEPEDGTIGVFCHEYGHVLGLPDLYDTDRSSQGIGDWGLMSGGSWGHRVGDPRGSSPVHMCGWSKMKLGWADIQIVEQVMEGAEIPPVVGSNIIYRLWTAGDENSREYFLVENRQQTGFDASLTTRQVRGGFAAPEGLLVTHIDDNLWHNEDELHRLVDIVEASPIYIDNDPRENLDGGLDYRGEWNLYNNHRGDDGDLYPGFSEHNEDSTEWTGDRNLDRFGSFTTPSSLGYNGSPSLVDIYDITLQDENVICSFSVTAAEQPFLIVSEYHISDEDGGNNNGFIEPGETIDLFIELENVGDQAAIDVDVTLEYEGDYIEITEGEYHIGGIAPGESTPLRSPFVFVVSDDAPNVLDFEFTLRITLEEYEFFYPLCLRIQPPHEWFKHPDNPVLTGSPDSWDADGIIAPAILVEDDKLKCWYVGSAEDGEDANTGSVGYAWSPDGGLTWKKHPEPVLTPDQDLDWIWAFTGLGIMALDDGYLMSFIAINEDIISNIGLAISEDGYNWICADQPILEPGDGWTTDLFQMGQLSIFPFYNFYGIAFSGVNEMGLLSIGVALSVDLRNWTIENSLVIDPTDNANDFDAYFMISPDVTIVDQGAQILYAGVGQDMVYRLGSLFTDLVNINRH